MIIETPKPDRAKNDQLNESPAPEKPRRLRDDIRQVFVVCPDTERLLRELNQE